MDLSLFPKNEEWGTGDEALDRRLESALKRVLSNLSFLTIKEFFVLGMEIKPRAYNPSLPSTIELTVKALLFLLAPEEYNDFLLKKLKGDYSHKNRVNFSLSEINLIKNELVKYHKYRYNDQIDFFLYPQNKTEKNPFIHYELKKSPYDLQSKIVFKEFRHFLSDDVIKKEFDDAFFQALQGGKTVLTIESFAEVWYHEGQLYSLPSPDLFA